MYETLEQARAELAAGLRDVAGDNPEMAEDDYAADIIEGVALNCTAEVAVELCRIELGWVPAGLKRLRPDIAAVAR